MNRNLKEAYKRILENKINIQRLFEAELPPNNSVDVPIEMGDELEFNPYNNNSVDQFQYHDPAFDAWDPHAGNDYYAGVDVDIGTPGHPYYVPYHQQPQAPIEIPYVPGDQNGPTQINPAGDPVRIPIPAPPGTIWVRVGGGWQLQITGGALNPGRGGAGRRLRWGDIYNIPGPGGQRPWPYGPRDGRMYPPGFPILPDPNGHYPVNIPPERYRELPIPPDATIPGNQNFDPPLRGNPMDPSTYPDTEDGRHQWLHDFLRLLKHWHGTGEGQEGQYPRGPYGDNLRNFPRWTWENGRIRFVQELGNATTIAQRITRFFRRLFGGGNTTWNAWNMGDFFVQRFSTGEATATDTQRIRTPRDPIIPIGQRFR